MEMETGLKVQAVGSFLLRYSLGLVIGWIRPDELTAPEAKELMKSSKRKEGRLL